VIVMLPPILSQISAEIHQQRCARKGGVLKIHPSELMAHWTFRVKFLYDTQFLFGTLMFAAVEDGTLRLLTRGPMPTHHQLIYGEAPYYLANPPTTLTSGGARSGLNPYVDSYAPTSMTSWGHPIGALCPSVQWEHGARLLGVHLSVGTQLKTTRRLWTVPSGTQPSRPTTSAQRIPPEHLPIIVPVDTQPSGDLKRPMHGHPATKLFGI
jgi:hypothetical protein